MRSSVTLRLSTADNCLRQDKTLAPSIELLHIRFAYMLTHFLRITLSPWPRNTSDNVDNVYSDHFSQKMRRCVSRQYCKTFGLVEVRKRSSMDGYLDTGATTFQLRATRRGGTRGFVDCSPARSAKVPTSPRVIIATTGAIGRRLCT